MFCLQNQGWSHVFNNVCPFAVYLTPSKCTSLKNYIYQLIENVAFAAKDFKLWFLFGRGNCLWNMLGSVQATFEGFTFTPWHCTCRKVHVAKQEHARGDLWARGVPDTGALLTACGKATGYTPKHKGTASLEGSKGRALLEKSQAEWSPSPHLCFP